MSFTKYGKVKKKRPAKTSRSCYWNEVAQCLNETEGYLMEQETLAPEALGAFIAAGAVAVLVAGLSDKPDPELSPEEMAGALVGLADYLAACVIWGESDEADQDQGPGERT